MNKIKHLFTLLLYCALGLSFHLKSFAGPISRDAALQKAVHFMLKNNMIGTSNTIKAQSIGYANAPQPFKHCFIFNAPQQGYVIVSGDDRTRSILGYSNEGHLDINNLQIGRAHV